MNLLQKVSFNRIISEFTHLDSSANFSTIQPSTITSPNTLEKQMKGSNPCDLTDASMKQISSYRAYKKRMESEKVKGKRKKTGTPIMPESLKKEIKRAKTIKQDDIAPTV